MRLLGQGPHTMQWCEPKISALTQRWTMLEDCFLIIPHQTSRRGRREDFWVLVMAKILKEWNMKTTITKIVFWVEWRIKGKDLLLFYSMTSFCSEFHQVTNSVFSWWHYTKWENKRLEWIRSDKLKRSTQTENHTIGSAAFWNIIEPNKTSFLSGV